MNVDAEINSRGFATDAEALRWSLALLFATLIHLGAAFVVLNWSKSDIASSEPPPAVTIDLAPIAAASNAIEHDVSPGPQMIEARSPASIEKGSNTIEAGPAPKEDKPEHEVGGVEPTQDVAETPNLTGEHSENDVKPVTPVSDPPRHPDQTVTETQQAGEEARALPPTQDEAEASTTIEPAQTYRRPQQPKAVVTAATPREPGAKERKAAAEQFDSGRRKFAIERTKAKALRVDRTEPIKPYEAREAPRTSAPPKTNAPQAEASGARVSSAADTTFTVATWKGELIAHLNRFKRFPEDATAGGTASVSFAIDPAGAVISARLAASSGDRRLDEEAVSILRRASPVPPPPTSLARGAVTLTVPIRFNR
jgi:periplasmic protein TonB